MYPQWNLSKQDTLNYGHQDTFSLPKYSACVRFEIRTPTLFSGPMVSSSTLVADIQLPQPDSTEVHNLAHVPELCRYHIYCVDYTQMAIHANIHTSE